MSERYWDSMNAAIELRVQREVAAAKERIYHEGYMDALAKTSTRWQSGYDSGLLAGYNQGVAESGGNPDLLKPSIQPERREA